MVTVTRNNKESREEIMSTLTNAVEVKTWAPKEDEVGTLTPVEVEEILADLENNRSRETVTDLPVTTSGEGVLARIARGIVAFYDRLSGPAMPERDRLNLYLKATELERRIGSQPRWLSHHSFK